MIRKTFDDAIGWLARYYNYNLSDERRERYWDDFQREPDEIFSDVCAKDLPNKLKSFPSPQELREAVSFARERAYSASKAKTAYDHRPVEQMLTRTQHGSELAKTVERLYAKTGPVAKMSYLADMRELHDKYPKAGYLAAADELEADWRRRGLLDESDLAPLEQEIIFIEPDVESS